MKKKRRKKRKKKKEKKEELSAVAEGPRIPVGPPVRGIRQDVVCLEKANSYEVGPPYGALKELPAHHSSLLRHLRRRLDI